MFDLFTRSDRRSDELLIITGNILESYPVVRVTAETVEAGDMILPREGLVELVRPYGSRTWMAQADLPARVEAEQIRRLRHNAIMQSLFEEGSPSVARVPWQVWGIVLVTLVFLGLAAVRG